MNHDAAVVTAIYDGYDTVKPVMPQVDRSFGYQAGVRVDWVLVTDDPGKLTEAEPGALSGWRIEVDRRPGMHPNRAAKYPKFLPHIYTQAPLTVWVDGSYRITSPHFVSEVQGYANPIAQFVHPWRDCALDEAEFSKTLPKYAGEPLPEQAAHYRGLNHPEHWGLWATGVIVMDHIGSWQLLTKFGQYWLDEVKKWSFQDQVSEPYALQTCGIRPTALPGDHLTNPWLKYEGSARH